MFGPVALLISVGLTVLTLTAVMLLIFGKVAAQRAKQAFRSGYWTGKSELQSSLDGWLSQHSEELQQRPNLLGVLLLQWIEDEDLSNRAMAQLQGH